MIYIFRKEMKKWRNLLWVVLAAFALTSGVAVWRRPRQEEAKIATINGENITFKEYRKYLNEINMQLEMIKANAVASKIPVDFFLRMFGLNDPDKLAFDRCVNNKLLDTEKKLLSLKLDSDYFDKELQDMLPAQIKDPNGNINLQAYKFYLGKMNTTITEFEQDREIALERSFVENFAQNSFYTPDKTALKNYINENAKKRFDILFFPKDLFLGKVQKEVVDQKDLEKYYEQNRENYRIPEKRNIRYVIVSPENFSKNIEVDDLSIENFYEKNKSSLYRIAPKVNVRHILLKTDKTMAAKDLDKILDKAKEIKKSLTQNNGSFAELAKKHSQDVSTSANGGLTGFFGKGTYDVEFEKAAMRLKDVGEISDIVKTGKGFEIIQLVQRQAATERSLESVRDEIAKNIRAKKALTNLSSELEKVLHELKSDKGAFDAFLSKNNLKSENTGFLLAQDSTGKELKNLLASKAFTDSGRSEKTGRFIFEGKQVLYQVIEIQKSFIPNLESIKNQVLSSFYKEKARKELKNVLKNSKKELLENKTNFITLAQKFGVKNVTTGLIKIKDEIKEFSHSDRLVHRAFDLDDPREVLQYKGETGYYIIKLIDSENLDLNNFNKSKISEKEEMFNKNKQMYTQAFIASLKRTAKIEKVAKILNERDNNVETETDL